MRHVAWVPALAVLLAAAPAEARFRKAPYVQHVTRTSAVIVFELWEPAPAQVRVRAITGAGEMPSSAPAATAEWSLAAGPATLHEIRVRGLAPSRRYAYVVTAAGARAEGEIATAPLPHEAFSFVVWGDTREGNDVHRALCERLALEAPDFVIHTGDLVNSGGNEDDWQTFFDIEHEIMRSTPVYPVIGNHDLEGLLGRVEHFRRYFSLPADGPETEPERYYAFGWGNSRFIILDSNQHAFALAEQTLWLEEQLAAAVADRDVRHIFVVMHHPLYSTATHGPLESARLAWAPLFERYRVDVVFAGHDHVYERLARGGVRYIVTGGGGAPLYFRRQRPPAEDAAASLVFDSANHYVRVHVAGDFVEVATVYRDGALADSLVFGARPAGVCRIDSDCDGLVHPRCSGAWRCVGQTCDWQCGAAAVVSHEDWDGTVARRPHQPTESRRALWLGALAVCLAGAAMVVRWRRRRG